MFPKAFLMAPALLMVVVKKDTSKHNAEPQAGESIRLAVLRCDSCCGSRSDLLATQMCRLNHLSKMLQTYKEEYSKSLKGSGGAHTHLPTDIGQVCTEFSMREVDSRFAGFLYN